MRVIAGTYRSRRLHTLAGMALRPTSDRLRETMFNILGSSVEDAAFVDVFAGSGAVGIEALSRGARRAIFVENHSAGVALLRRNLASLGIAVSETRFGRASQTKLGGTSAKISAPVAAFPGTAEIVAADAEVALERLAARRIRVDFVFVDPPYADSDAYESVLELLGEGELVAKDGMVIVEHDRRRALPALAEQLERTRVVEQGDSALTFYRLVLAA